LHKVLDRLNALDMIKLDHEICRLSCARSLCSELKVDIA